MLNAKGHPTFAFGHDGCGVRLGPGQDLLVIAKLLLGVDEAGPSCFGLAGRRRDPGQGEEGFLPVCLQ